MKTEKKLWTHRMIALGITLDFVLFL